MKKILWLGPIKMDQNKFVEVWQAASAKSCCHKLAAQLNANLLSFIQL
jgi:hypothetical protein